MIQKFPDNNDRPITILSLAHPERISRTVTAVIHPLFDNDALARTALAYWLIDVPEGQDSQYLVSRAYNDALWECPGEVVIFTTGDSVLPAHLIWRALGVSQLLGAAVACARADQVAENDDRYILNDDAIGDFILTRRDWALHAGGWDERMTAWGFQDYSFAERLGAASGHGVVLLGDKPHDRVVHLWHPRRDDAWYRQQNVINRSIWFNEPPWTQADFMAAREIMSHA